MNNIGLTETREGYLIFLVGGKEYGISVKIVSSVLNPLQNFSLKQTFDIGKGYILINDYEIPLIDFYEILNLSSVTPQSVNTRIIIVDFNSYKFAFYVEKVKEFISVNTDSIMRFESSAPRQSIIKQYIIMPGRNILLPDFEKIFIERL